MVIDCTLLQLAVQFLASRHNRRIFLEPPPPEKNIRLAGLDG